MAKKKVTKKKKSSPPAPEGASPQIEEHRFVGKVPEYEKGSWSGKVQYQCKLCAFDCLEDEGRMLEHLVNVHNSEAALEKVLEFEAQSTPSEVVMLQEPNPTPLPSASPQIDGADLGGDDVVYFEVEVTDEQKAELEALKEKEDGKN